MPAGVRLRDLAGACTAVVGAGGKKTTLYALASRLPRAVLTATVRIPIFDDRVAAVRVGEDPIEGLRAPFPLGLVAERERADRYRGYDPERVDTLAAAHDGPVLVKADGARTRLFKAPGEHEPRIPASADRVLALASVRAVGEPLDETAVHRPERVAALTGLDPGDPITPAAVATTLAHPEGGRKGVPADATWLPVLNMVDDDGLESVAREVAAELRDRVDVADVVLARMADPAVVAVV